MRACCRQPAAARRHGPAERPAHDRRPPEPAACAEAGEGSQPLQAGRPDEPMVRHVTEIVPPEHHPEVEAPAGWIIAPTGLSVDMKAHPFPVGT